MLEQTWIDTLKRIRKSVGKPKIQSTEYFWNNLEASADMFLGSYRDDEDEYVNVMVRELLDSAEEEGWTKKKVAYMISNDVERFVKFVQEWMVHSVEELEGMEEDKQLNFIVKEFIKQLKVNQ